MNDKEPKLPTLDELVKLRNQLKHQRETVNAALAHAEEERTSVFTKEQQELQSAKARLMKKVSEDRRSAEKVAEEAMNQAFNAIQREYEDEILPATQRRDAKKKEAAEDCRSKKQTAVLAYRDGADELHKELQDEVQKLKVKYDEDVDALNAAAREKKKAMDAQLDAYELAIRKASPKPEAKKETIPTEQPTA